MRLEHMGGNTLALQSGEARPKRRREEADRLRGESVGRKREGPITPLHLQENRKEEGRDKENQKGKNSTKQTEPNHDSTPPSRDASWRPAGLVRVPNIKISN